MVWCFQSSIKESGVLDGIHCSWSFVLVIPSTNKIGRSDHQYAAFPAETVKLDEPKKSDARLQGSSGMRAVARWKFSVRGKSSEWLSFNKGEIITNIGCECNIETCQIHMTGVKPVSVIPSPKLTTRYWVHRFSSGTLVLERNEFERKDGDLPTVSYRARLTRGSQDRTRGIESRGPREQGRAVFADIHAAPERRLESL